MNWRVPFTREAIVIYWLKREAYGWDVAKCIVYCVALALVLNLIILGIYSLCGVQPTPVAGSGEELFSLSFILILALTALLEEVLFRLPLALFVRWWDIRAALIVAAMVSVVFGFLHGDVWHVLIQGASGFLYCIVYLKCGGSWGRYWKGLFSAFAAHALFNAICAAAMMAAGETKF